GLGQPVSLGGNPLRIGGDFRTAFEVVEHAGADDGEIRTIIGEMRLDVNLFPRGSDRRPRFTGMQNEVRLPRTTIEGVLRRWLVVVLHALEEAPLPFIRQVGKMRQE